MHFPMLALSTRQDTTASSTPEAEIVAADTVLITILIVALDMWEVLRRKPKLLGILKKGNAAAIRVMVSATQPPCRAYNEYMVLSYLACRNVSAQLASEDGVMLKGHRTMQ